MNPRAQGQRHSKRTSQQLNTPPPHQFPRKEAEGGSEQEAAAAASPCVPKREHHHRTQHTIPTAAANHPESVKGESTQSQDSSQVLPIGNLSLAVAKATARADEATRSLSVESSRTGRSRQNGTHIAISSCENQQSSCTYRGQKKRPQATRCRVTLQEARPATVAPRDSKRVQHPIQGINQQRAASNGMIPSKPTRRDPPQTGQGFTDPATPSCEREQTESRRTMQVPNEGLKRHEPRTESLALQQHPKIPRSKTVNVRNLPQLLILRPLWRHKR